MIGDYSGEMVSTTGLGKKVLRSVWRNIRSIGQPTTSSAAIDRARSRSIARDPSAVMKSFPKQDGF
jgi:hypothetical protein